MTKKEALNAQSQMRDQEFTLAEVEKQLRVFCTTPPGSEGRREAAGFLAANFENMVVDISAVEGIIDLSQRYVAQVCDIPANKRGNLSKYRGKKVIIVPTTITRFGPRINFLIKEVPQ